MSFVMMYVIDIISKYINYSLENNDRSINQHLGDSVA